MKYKTCWRRRPHPQKMLTCEWKQTPKNRTPCSLHVPATKFAGPLAQGVLDLEPGAITFFLSSPLTPTVDLWPPNYSRSTMGMALFANPEITDSTRRLVPKRPDHISNYHLGCSEMLWKSPISLRGSSRMDFEMHQCSYMFKKQLTSERYTKPELFILHKDFTCFELLGFPSDLFSPLYVSKKTLKQHLCENTCI